LSKYYPTFTIFGTNITERLSNQKLVNFPPHLNSVSVSTLPTGKTQTVANASFQLNTVYYLSRKQAKHTEIITSLHSNSPTFIKQSIVYTEHDQETKQIIQRSVMCRISIYQVSRGFGFGWQLGISNVNNESLSLTSME